MMNYMSAMPIQNIASLLAEDAGVPELRNPLNSGMQAKNLLISGTRAKNLLIRLFSRKNKAE